MAQSTNPKFEVIVGNIGTVYSGNNYMAACAKYRAYVSESCRAVGRASGESVVLFKSGEIDREHLGQHDDFGVEDLPEDPSNGGQF